MALHLDLTIPELTFELRVHFPISLRKIFWSFVLYKVGSHLVENCLRRKMVKLYMDNNEIKKVIDDLSEVTYKPVSYLEPNLRSSLYLTFCFTTRPITRGV